MKKSILFAAAALALLAGPATAVDIQLGGLGLNAGIVWRF